MPFSLRIITILFFYALFATVSSGQSCTLTSPINSNYPTSETNLIEVIKRSESNEYTPTAFTLIKKNIDACNASLQNQVFVLQGEMSLLSQKYQSILKYKDVSGMEKQIRDLEESKKRAEQELESSLLNIKQAGLYIVLLANLKGYINPQLCIDQAKNAATWTAVNDLLGAKIKRFSQVESYGLVKDNIQQFVGGEVKSERLLMNRPDNVNKLFVYVAKLAATPLKTIPQGNETTITTNTIVLNPKLDVDWEVKLKNANVQEDYIKQVADAVKTNISLIDNENQAQNELMTDLLQKSTDEIKEINAKIQKIKNDLRDRGAKIKAYCTEFGVPYTNNNIDQCVEQLLTKIKTQLLAKTKTWETYNEQQIETRNPARVTLDASGEKTFAVRALELCTQLQQQFSTVDRVQQITEVENFQTTKFDESRKITFYRQLDHFWGHYMTIF
jgi:hypothetical protein